jgi:putative transcriptional regulator
MKYGDKTMAVSYKKLWKLLIDKEMNKQDLREKTKISKATITKMGKNENVNLDVLSKICSSLHCDIGDIVEIVPEAIIEEEIDNGTE